MIISHSRRFVFVHIHKAGGTSVEQALDPHLAWNDLILGGSPFGERLQAPYKKRFGLSKHSSIADIEAVCGRSLIEDYFTFALVRHPVTRVCSIYNFVATTVNNWAVRHNVPLADVARRITPQAAKKAPGLAWLSTRIFLKTGGFSEFLRHKDIAQAPGFRSQTASLSSSLGNGPVGTIFKLEDYPSWAGALSEKLVLDFELPHANQSGVRLVEPETVSATDAELIRDMFNADFETFGYTT
ncbi:MAG: sulfotransferase family 2 domain-containing protein [Rhizomicrobium sp.]|jgi:hypothetical protein